MASPAASRHNRGCLYAYLYSGSVGRICGESQSRSSGLPPEDILVRGDTKLSPQLALLPRTLTAPFGNLRRSGALGLLALVLVPAGLLAGEFRVRPDTVAFDRNFAQAQLLVTVCDAAGAVNERSEDLTVKAAYTSSDPNIVSVTPAGRLLAVGNGQATITVAVEGVPKSVTVTVAGIVPDPYIGFAEQVSPVMSKAGCNAGACHASQHGKGGFILSVFGYDTNMDFQNIVRDRMQRRISLNAPMESLLLRKPTMQVPHGGGRRLEAGSVDYQIIAGWIAGGAPPPKADAPKVTKIAVTPTQRVGEVGMRQQLQVLATFSDGVTRDVTAWAKFDSMDDGVVAVNSNGLMTTVGRGQATAMVRFEGQAEISTVVVPYAASVELAGWQDNNFVDQFAAAKFKELGIAPSPLCDDATFLRRAFLDAVGTLPTVEESVAFLDSPDPEKRKKLVDRLLGFTGDPAQDIYNDKYAALWTLKWADLIRNSSAALGDQGMWSLHNWLSESFRTNKPFDYFVRELVTAKGPIFSSGPANYFRIANSPPDLAESTAQLFLGVRLQCAKCHHHPFEKYSQGDYYSFAAFFSRVGTKSSQDTGLFTGETVVVVRSGGEISHPRTGAVLKPTPLDGEPTEDPLDRRIPLANWLTSPSNEMFARNVVNRYMAYLLGRGLVDPVDDMRATNPPSNVGLMEALAKDFRDSRFNVKHLMRTIMNSRLYQLDSQPTPQNASDSRFYSHYRVKRIGAEPLLDAIDYVTGSATKFPNLPQGTRAIELPDSNYQNYFLMTFGKPKRVSVCECERVADENLAQALHTLNGDILAAKIADVNGRIAKLEAAKKTHEEIVTELYLTTLSRRPTAAELAASQKFLAEIGNSQEAYQDLMWALVNSKQFLFVH